MGIQTGSDCASGDLQCINLNDIKSFTNIGIYHLLSTHNSNEPIYLGCIMFFFVICLAMAARYYHLELYEAHGVGPNHARYLYNRNNEYIAKQAHAAQTEKVTPAKNRHPIAEEFSVLILILLKFD